MNLKEKKALLKPLFDARYDIVAKRKLPLFIRLFKYLRNKFKYYAFHIPFVGMFINQDGLVQWTRRNNSITFRVYNPSTTYHISKRSTKMILPTASVKLLPWHKLLVKKLK